MTTKCGFCKGTGIEPGFTECVWCNNTGRDGGTSPEATKNAIAPRFTKGDTDPVGDCDKFEAGINVGEWFQRIVVYGDSPADAEALRDEVMALAAERDSLKTQLDASQSRRRQFAEEVTARLNALDERADGLEQRNAELVALLSEYEWADWEPYDSYNTRAGGSYCIECGNHKEVGHDDDCKISAAIKPTESGASE